MIEVDWLKKWSLYSANAVAFKDDESETEWTYSRLYFLSCRLATELKERFGIRPGQRIAVLASNEVEYVLLFFAAQRIGAILVPINTRLTAREVEHVFTDSSPTLLVHQDQFQNLIGEVGPSATPEKRWLFEGESGLSRFLKDQVLAQNWELPMSADAFEAPCMILYTSGTTGSPKGAIITNKMLHWNSINTTMRLNLGQNDVGVSFLPFFHTGGWNVLLTPFVHRGAKTVLMKKFNPARVLELCEKERITVLFGVPTTMEMMAREPEFSRVDFSSVRYAIVGGEPMPVELIKTWEAKGVPIRQGYGLTEFGPNVFSLNEEDSLRKIGSIGFPNFYIEARVVDDEGADLPSNQVGELLLRGPVCTPGYWNLPRATAETIQDGWLRTGDLVRRDTEGYFYVAGRKKDMFISGGENVYPVEIERVLSSHSDIREVAVIGVPDPKWGEVGKAFVAARAGATIDENEILEFCKNKLAKFKIPKQIEFCSELPKGDSGKILKRRLKELSQNETPLNSREHVHSS